MDKTDHSVSVSLKKLTRKKKISRDYHAYLLLAYESFPIVRAVPMAEAAHCLDYYVWFYKSENGAP